MDDPSSDALAEARASSLRREFGHKDFTRALPRACARERRPSSSAGTHRFGFFLAIPLALGPSSAVRAVGIGAASDFTVRDSEVEDTSHPRSTDEKKPERRRPQSSARRDVGRGCGRLARSFESRRFVAFARRPRGGDSEVERVARGEGRDRNLVMATGLGLGQFAFVGTFIAAVKKTIAGPREEPPEHLKCVITQELFTDPVVLVQTGYTYERAAILRWLNAKFPPTDPTSNVELWCTDIVPNWSLRQSVDEWGLANGYGVLDPPEEATRVTKDGRHVARRSANATSASALTHQYLQALHRAHPRQAAILVFLMTFTLGTITVTTLTVAHSVYSAVSEFLQDARVAWLVAGPAQSAVWWGGVGAFLWLANRGPFADPPARVRPEETVGRGLFLRLGARR